MRAVMLIALVMFSFLVSGQEAGLTVGDKVPGFEALSDDGSIWKAEDYIGKKYLVIYFYPAAMTGGCTAQACAYRDLSSDLSSEDAMVVGISGDHLDGLKLFRKANNLNFTLLSDASGKIAGIFGVPVRDGGKISREIDGQHFDLIRDVTTSRWTFIVDKTGTVVYKNDAVNASKDTEEVLSFLKKK